jgi:hypothetical protein
MKINLTDHELQIIICVLREANSMIANHLATTILNQDPADDGPEVAILSVPHDSL